MLSHSELWEIILPRLRYDRWTSLDELYLAVEQSGKLSGDDMLPEWRSSSVPKYRHSIRNLLQGKKTSNPNKPAIVLWDRNSNYRLAEVDYVHSIDDLRASVRQFMKAPHLWREAVGSHPKYFVHFLDTDGAKFGLSKFSALRDITLEEYVREHRYRKDGHITQERIKRVCGRDWIPVSKIAQDLRDDFVGWFGGFYKGEYDLDRLSLISLGEVSGVATHEATEVRDLKLLIEESAGRRSMTQGRRISVQERQAIETHAMRQAEEHYTAQGWNVIDVSRYKSYDLHCTRLDGRELHVEVKGTTSEAQEVILTPNEVAHARTYYPQVALFILAKIQLDSESDTRVLASGGTRTVFEPWDINLGELAALAYSYHIPTKPKGNEPS